MGIMTLSKHGAKAPVEETPVNEKVSKKDEAFKLFSQGKTGEDSEVLALGLVASTITKYYREWENLNPAEEASEEES